MNFCENCGNKLTLICSDKATRHFCEHCHQIKYLDPKVAVVVLVTKEANLLLVKRAIEPNLGKWSFPSGYVDRGENVEAASIREVKEETNLDIKIEGLIGVYSGKGPVILVVHSAVALLGTPIPNDEVSEIKWFPIKDLPGLPFPHDKEIMRDYLLKLS